MSVCRYHEALEYVDALLLTPQEKFTLTTLMASIKFLIDHELITDQAMFEKAIDAFVDGLVARAMVKVPDDP